MTWLERFVVWCCWITILLGTATLGGLVYLSCRIGPPPYASHP